MPRFENIASFCRLCAGFSANRRMTYHSFYAICALLTRKKEGCQTKQEKAKAALAEIERTPATDRGIKIVPSLTQWRIERWGTSRN